MSANTLHVTNGDSVVHLWKKAGITGTQVIWRDVLFEGPVPPALSLRELSAVRARYLAEAGYGNAIRLNRDFELRDFQIARAREFDAIVLWFEHDLFDQLHILQILEALREAGVDEGAAELVQSEHYLGMMTAEELGELYPKRRHITGTTVRSAAAAWKAFTSADPRDLEHAARQEYRGLPFMRAALRRLCEEYPAVGTGLSRTQRQILDVVSARELTAAEIFTRTQSQEEAPFQGDASIEREVRELATGPAPLLDAEEGRYRLTVLGRRILAGDADRYEGEVPERWIGGVRIDPRHPWRWDDAHQAFAAPAPVVET